MGGIRSYWLRVSLFCFSFFALCTFIVCSFVTLTLVYYSIAIAFYETNTPDMVLNPIVFAFTGHTHVRIERINITNFLCSSVGFSSSLFSLATSIVAPSWVGLVSPLAQHHSCPFRPPTWWSLQSCEHS